LTINERFRGFCGFSMAGVTLLPVQILLRRAERIVSDGKVAGR